MSYTAVVMSEDLGYAAFGKSGFTSLTAAEAWVREQLVGGYTEGAVIPGDNFGCCTEGVGFGYCDDHQPVSEIYKS